MNKSTFMQVVTHIIGDYHYFIDARKNGFRIKVVRNPINEEQTKALQALPHVVKIGYANEKFGSYFCIEGVTIFTDMRPKDIVFSHHEKEYFLGFKNIEMTIVPSNKNDKKSVLEELILLIKDMKFGTDCGGGFMGDECEECKEYYRCKGTYEHREKCDILLKRLNEENS